MEGRNYIHVSVGNFNLDIAVYLNSFPKLGETALVRSIEIRPGGAATNYAVAVAQYGHYPYLIASVSSQSIVKSAMSSVSELGVDVTKIKVVDQPPGSVVIIIQPEGERTMLKYPGANELLQPADVPDHLIAQAHVLHMASIKPSIASSIAHKARPKGVVITYDPGAYIESLRECSPNIFKDVDILFVNEREFKALMESFSVEDLFKYGLSLLVVKMGSRGAAIRLPSGICYRSYTTPVKRPVDSTGAGDAFDALFNAKYIESKDPGLALMYGVAAGALKAGCRGSFLCWDRKLFDIQLKKTQLEKSLNRCF